MTATFSCWHYHLILRFLGFQAFPCPSALSAVDRSCFTANRDHHSAWPAEEPFEWYKLDHGPSA